MDNMDLNNGSKNPWWARSRDGLFALIILTLLGTSLGFVPSPISKAIDTLFMQHSRIERVLEVMCVHQAKDNRERAECLDGRR